jgi:hypothetical protein
VVSLGTSFKTLLGAESRSKGGARAPGYKTQEKEILGGSRQVLGGPRQVLGRPRQVLGGLTEKNKMHDLSLIQGKSRQDLGGLTQHRDFIVEISAYNYSPSTSVLPVLESSTEPPVVISKRSVSMINVVSGLTYIDLMRNEPLVSTSLEVKPSSFLRDKPIPMSSWPTMIMMFL